MERERLKEILLNPQDFTWRIDSDNWIIIKKKDEIKDLTTEQIIESESYYLNDSVDFAVDILNELNIKSLNIE